MRFVFSFCISVDCLIPHNTFFLAPVIFTSAYLVGGGVKMGVEVERNRDFLFNQVPAYPSPKIFCFFPNCLFLFHLNGSVFSFLGCTMCVGGDLPLFRWRARLFLGRRDSSYILVAGEILTTIFLPLAAPHPSSHVHKGIDKG